MLEVVVLVADYLKHLITDYLNHLSTYSFNHLSRSDARNTEELFLKISASIHISITATQPTIFQPVFERDLSTIATHTERSDTH